MDDGKDVLYDLACECETLFDTQLAKLRAQALPLADLLAEYQQRFAIWAAHLGVFARKSQSLDTRLRNHADIQDLVARLLDILRRSLDQLMVASEATETGAVSRVVDGAPRALTLSTVDATLTRLNRLGVTIRQSSRSRIDVKIQSFAANLDLEPFAAVSQIVVQQLYPNAHRSLQQRLAKTMVDRYAAIMFAKHRKGKLRLRRAGDSRGFMPRIDEALPVKSGRQLPGLTRSGGISQNMPSGALGLGYGGLAGTTSAAAKSDLSTVNSTQLRQAIFKTNSFQLPTERAKGTSSVQVGQGNYPRLSHQEGSNFFTCEWCSKMIEKGSMNDSDWRRHIDEDLKPYACIHDACSESHPAFPSFAPWFAHMKGHDRRWHQRTFPTSSWICAVCDDIADPHTSPETLHDHLVQAHGDMFPAPQLQAIARQSKVERLRRWNECLLCCFTVEEAEQPPKRHREQFVNKAGIKSRRTSFAMKHARADRADDQVSDESDQPLGVAGLTLTDDDTEAMARHVAAHLQVLMLLTIRLVGIYGDDGHETQDDANSASVDVGDSDDGFLTRSKSELLRGIAPVEEVDMLDADDGALEAANVAQDDLVIPDAVVDFDGVPRRHDELLPEEDGFLQELINSGAYQAHLQTPHDAENEQSQSRPSTPLAEDDSGEEYDWRPNPDRSVELLENLKPSYQGFKEHLLNVIPQLGASIDHYLVGRIAQQQVTRYTRLEGLQVKHLQAVAAGNCASGTLCDAFKGTRDDPEKRLDVPFANHSDSDSGEDDPSLEEAITAEHFPRDIPLPRTKSLPARFECHLCFSTVKIRKPSDWTKHVHEDVQPFACTWERCKTPRMFKRKVDWARHENEAHRRLEWWTCDVEDCGHIVYRRDNFLQHLVREHKLPEPKLNLRAAVKKSTNIDPTWARVDQCHHENRAVPQDEPCRFCGKAFSSWKRLTVHLAKHMEYISLQALKLVLKEAAGLDKDAIIDAAQKRPLIPPPDYGPFLQPFSETFPGPSPDSYHGPPHDSYPGPLHDSYPAPFPEPSPEPFPDYYPDPFI